MGGELKMVHATELNYYNYHYLVQKLILRMSGEISWCSKKTVTL